MEEKPWVYYPEMVDPELFDSLLPQLLVLCKTYTMTIYDKTFEVKKISAVFSNELNDSMDAKSKGFGYDQVPIYSWCEAPYEILKIKQDLETELGIEFDYVLAHVYRNYEDYIGWHNDKEALNSQIVSVSLGATRRFQLRPINWKKGFSDEYILRSGDVIHMIGPRCQHEYKHRVPKMTLKDMKRHLAEYGLEGKRTIKDTIKVMEDNDLIPVRINLTFRQF